MSGGVGSRAIRAAVRLSVDPKKNLPWADLSDGLDIRGRRAGFTEFAATRTLAMIRRADE